LIKNALRDEAGHPFDLQQYVDQDACFISEKFKDGKILKVYKPKACRSESKETYIIRV